VSFAFCIVFDLIAGDRRRGAHEARTQRAKAVTMLRKRIVEEIGVGLVWSGSRMCNYCALSELFQIPRSKSAAQRIFKKSSIQ
jgi:hypothetical protein